jgi:hypothetical protein
METMSEFNKGDRVLVTSLNPTASNEIKIGDVRTVTDTCVDMVRLDNILTGWLFRSNIELVPEDIKPKWTIYNNTLPWSQLSDKQKGKLLLAAHAKMLFYGFGIELPSFKYSNVVYKVEEVVKPEPTMEELFVLNWMSHESFYKKDVAANMIAKGWTKSCK